MRRPASRKPPRLPDFTPVQTPRAEKVLTPRQRLKGEHVVGTHARFGREELRARLRRVVSGDPEYLLGLEPFEDVTLDDVLAAMARHFAYVENGASVAIDGNAALAQMARAVERVRSVAAHGGSIGLATSRPASMLGILQALACVAEIDGGDIMTLSRSAAFKVDGRSNRRLWWYGGVAAVSDGTSIIPVRRVDAAEEWLFLIGRPDLVIADGPFAGVAIASGIETVAFADLDDGVLALAADAGLPVSIVPVDTSRPPMAYAALLSAPAPIEPVSTPDAL
jgi:hypothetical protein